MASRHLIATAALLFAVAQPAFASQVSVAAVRAAAQPAQFAAAKAPHAVMEAHWYDSIVTLVHSIMGDDSGDGGSGDGSGTFHRG